MKSFFTPKDLARVLDITYRQIQYWDKTGFIKPSYRRRGKYRLYTFADLVQMKIAELLREKNVSIQRLRKIVKRLRELLGRVPVSINELTMRFRLHTERDEILVFTGQMFSDSREIFSFSVAQFRGELNTLFLATSEEEEEFALFADAAA